MPMLKTYKCLLVIALMGIFSIPGFTQKRISGVVRDSHSEEPIPFASISFRNSTIGKLSDSAGHFSFYLDQWPSDSLEFTCVGYQPFYLLINKTRDTIQANVLMERGTFNDGANVKVK